MNGDKSRLNTPENKWRLQIDRFVQNHQNQLAALAWGLQQEWGDPNLTLGIDLKPTPHFVVCSKESLETLNNNVRGQLQEILGILDNRKPEEEVSIVAIGEGQVKLIHFQSNPSPPICFEETEEDIDSLIQLLENQLAESINLS